MKPDVITSTTTELTPAKEEEGEILSTEEITTKDPLEDLPSDNPASSGEFVYIY